MRQILSLLDKNSTEKVSLQQVNKKGAKSTKMLRGFILHKIRTSGF